MLDFYFAFLDSGSIQGIPSTANVIVQVNADVALLLLLLLLLVVQSLTPKSALSVGPSSCAAR